MNSPVRNVQITHECLDCHQHHPAHLVTTGSCPCCGGERIAELQDATAYRDLPRFHAKHEFKNSAFTYAHEHGIDGIELDGIAQAIQRLAKHSSTVITKHQARALASMKDLGYVRFSDTVQGTVEIELMAPGALLSSYFWSVWVPHFLQARGYQTLVMPFLAPDQDVQHCTVAFQITGSREATRLFLADIAERFNDVREAEITHIQAGNLFELLDNARCS
jgi:hypothetical protein